MAVTEAPSSLRGSAALGRLLGLLLPSKGCGGSGLYSWLWWWEPVLLGILALAQVCWGHLKEDTVGGFFPHLGPVLSHWEISAPRPSSTAGVRMMLLSINGVPNSKWRLSPPQLPCFVQTPILGTNGRNPLVEVAEMGMFTCWEPVLYGTRQAAKGQSGGCMCLQRAGESWRLRG